MGRYLGNSSHCDPKAKTLGRFSPMVSNLPEEDPSVPTGRFLPRYTYLTGSVVWLRGCYFKHGHRSCEEVCKNNMRKQSLLKHSLVLATLVACFWLGVP